MSVSENVIALRFADRATAYQALSGLKHLSSPNAEVSGAVLVEHLEGGTMRFTDGMGREAGRNTAATAARGAVDLFTPQVPPDGTVIFAEARETNTETLDLLALWYGAVLERRPIDAVHSEPEAAAAGVADMISRIEARDRRDRERAETAATFENVVASLKQKSAA
ncbi:hypothetical protein [Streptomyces blattellae]|uniref:hypothetical protein n=1 Tax=Streptomyces blattellae TaxID=2569855 RepID=UPI0018ACBAEE|nr:hypothetical protein [Streptomyces blattellae]